MQDSSHASDHVIAHQTYLNITLLNITVGLARRCERDNDDLDFDEKIDEKFAEYTRVRKRTRY